jgi:hypothetical protein
MKVLQLEKFLTFHQLNEADLHFMISHLCVLAELEKSIKPSGSRCRDWPIWSQIGEFHRAREGKQDACRRIFYLKIRRGGAVGPALSGTYGGLMAALAATSFESFWSRSGPLVCIQET